MKPTKFMSVKQKEAVLKDWKRFIENGFGREYFTEKIYDHLNLHCSFIAHFNHQGFYGTYFEDPDDTMKFLKQFDKDYGYRSIEYGTTYWFNDEDYNDLNSAMVESLEPYKAEIYANLKQKTKDMKLRQIEKLKAEIENSD